MMTDGSATPRPHGREHEPAPEEQSRSQDELDRDALSSGGDAAAAGSVEEREAVATDEDDTWENADD
jgi:hypothetical protein